MNRFLIIFYSVWALTTQGQALDPSVLASGKWYKLSVEVDAVYKIDYNLLKNLGVNPDGIDPKKIQLFAGMNGMLPQPNNTPRVTDLKEVAVFVKGGDDGKFNSDDYLLFYGQGPDAYQLLPAKGIFQYQNNLFTDKNFYFLTVGTGVGKRMNLLDNMPGNFPAINEFEDFAYYETEQYNDLHSGRDWFGEQFDSKTEYTIRFDMSGVSDGSIVKLVSNVMGQSFGTSSFQISINDVPVGEQFLAPLLNSQYSLKGSEAIDTLNLTSNAIKAPGRANQDVKLKFVKAASGRSVGYLDFLLLQSRRKLALYGDQTVFHSLKSLEQPVSHFSVANMTTDAFVWDITDPFNGSIQKTSFESGNSVFSAASSGLRKYIAVSNKNFPAPKAEGTVPNQNLHGRTVCDLLIVAAPEFISHAQRLATHRQSKNGLSVMTVTTQQVYNEFSGGKQDVSAIRDLVKFLYDQKTGVRNLLLFGRGSYDYKNYLPYNKNFVPTYESRNSLSPLETYSSDDYFGFLENNEGNWGENPAEPHTLDIGVGRLPVKRADEAQVLVDKIIEYESQNWGDWRKEILFVADDGDFNIHQGQADQMAETIESDHPEFNTKKLFLDSFKQSDSPIGQVSTDAKGALIDAVRSGVLIVNYTGHGSEQQWMQERILDQVSLDKWDTAPHYPLLVTATCEFGRNDDPGLISTAELSMIKKAGGTIGLVTTARPVNSSTNFTLNKAFYQAAFVKGQSRFRDLGAIVRDTKNNSMSGVSNRNFTLLADPSMTLALPFPDLRIEQIRNMTSGSDTLKALSRVKVSGSVYSNGIPNQTYSGTVTGTLFGKLTSEKTKGDENPPFDFKARDNALFHGEVSVHSGQFELEFTVPKSIDPLVGLGKMALYAAPATGASDLTGVNASVKIGGLEKNPGTDAVGPIVELFMGDTTFVNGGIAGRNSRIVAILSDNNGINISNFDAQNNITAILDDTLSLVLNQYFQSDLDNFKRGKVDYPIDDLKPGHHLLTLRASDTFGNRSTAAIDFSVSDENGIQIEQWMTYPNPVSTSTTFFFKHNRSGEDLEAVVTVYNQVGQPVVSTAYQITSSEYKVLLPEWDATAANGTKLSAGLYLLKLSVRSQLDGSKNEKITKVIISN